MARLRIDFYSQTLHMNSSAVVIMPENLQDFIHGGMHHWDFWDKWLPVFMDQCGFESRLS